MWFDESIFVLHVPALCVSVCKERLDIGDHMHALTKIDHTVVFHLRSLV